MRLAPLARIVTLLSLALALLSPGLALAKPRPKPAASVAAAPAPSASADETPSPPELNWRPGPTLVELGHDLTLDLPASYIYLPMPEAGKLLEKNGSLHNEDLMAVVTGEGDADWAVIIRYEEAGFVKDDEKIDAAELLKTMREGQVDANKEREEHGFLPLTLGEWSEPPRYEKGLHHLVWALPVISSKQTSINFNTRVLGRRGFVSLNLVTSPEKLAEVRANGATLLGATKFKPGARYEDFNEKTDKVAEYGLIGLILGGAGLGAAKLVKVGFLATFWKSIVAFLLAAKKLVVVGIAAIGAFFKKLFGGKKADEGTG